jgi:hypothetical protein
MLNVAPTTMNVYGTAQFKEAKNTDYLCYNVSDLRQTAFRILQRQIFMLYSWCITRYCLQHKLQITFIEKMYYEVGPHCFRPEDYEIELFIANPKFLWRFSMRNYAYFAKSFNDKHKEPWFDAELRTFDKDDSPILPYLKPQLWDVNVMTKLFKDAPVHGKFKPFKVSKIHKFMKDNLKYHPSDFDTSEIYYSDDFYLHHMNGATRYTEFLEFLIAGQNGISPGPLLKAQLEKSLQRQKMSDKTTEKKHTHTLAHNSGYKMAQKEMMQRDSDVDGLNGPNETDNNGHDSSPDRLTSKLDQYQSTLLYLTSGHGPSSLTMNEVSPQEYGSCRQIYYKVPAHSAIEVPGTAVDFLGQTPCGSNVVQTLGRIVERNSRLVLIMNHIYRKTDWVEQAYMHIFNSQVEFYRYCKSVFGDACSISNFGFQNNGVGCRVGWTLPCDETYASAFIERYVERVVLPIRAKIFRVLVNMKLTHNIETTSDKRKERDHPVKSIRFDETKNVINICTKDSESSRDSHSPIDDLKEDDIISSPISTMDPMVFEKVKEKVKDTDLEVTKIIANMDLVDFPSRRESEAVSPWNNDVAVDDVSREDFANFVHTATADDISPGVVEKTTATVSFSSSRASNSDADEAAETAPLLITKLRVEPETEIVRPVHPRIASILSSTTNRLDNFVASHEIYKSYIPTPDGISGWDEDQSKMGTSDKLPRGVRLTSDASNIVITSNDICATLNNINDEGNAMKEAIDGNVEHWQTSGTQEGAISNCLVLDDYDPEKLFGSVNWGMMFASSSASSREDDLLSESSEDKILLLELFNRVATPDAEVLMSVEDQKKETKFGNIDTSELRGKFDFTNLLETGLTEGQLDDVVHKLIAEIEKSCDNVEDSKIKELELEYTKTNCFEQILRDVEIHPNKYSVSCIPFPSDPFEDTNEFKLDMACFLALYHIKHRTIGAHEFEHYVDRTVELQTQSKAHARFVYLIAKDRHYSQLHLASLHRELKKRNDQEIIFLENTYDHKYESLCRQYASVVSAGKCCKYTNI